MLGFFFLNGTSYFKLVTFIAQFLQFGVWWDPGHSVCRPAVPGPSPGQPARLTASPASPPPAAASALPRDRGLSSRLPLGKHAQTRHRWAPCTHPDQVPGERRGLSRRHHAPRPAYEIISEQIKSHLSHQIFSTFFLSNFLRACRAR